MLTEVPAAGGTVYDAFIVELLRNAGAEVIVTTTSTSSAESRLISA